MDRFEIGTLRAYYGALITEKQNEWLRLHYDEDISLGEDGIKRGEKALRDFESKLGLAGRGRKVLRLLGEAKQALAEGRTADCAALIADAESALEE